MFNTVCNKLGLPEAGRYWDQSIDSLKELITTANCLDDVDKKYYLDRLEHYCHLSLNSMPNKSSLYDVVFEFVGQTAYKLGESAASVRKELDMWEMTFREPLTTDTPDDLKARKEEIDKIKAEWLKKAKKKKWGEEEER